MYIYICLCVYIYIYTYTYIYQRQLRNIPGVPIVFINHGQVILENLSDVTVKTAQVRLFSMHVDIFFPRVYTHVRMHVCNYACVHAHMHDQQCTSMCVTC